MTYNPSAFLRPMPGATALLPPLDGGLREAGDSFVNSIQQGRANDRANQQLALQGRQIDLSDRREQDYMGLQNRMEDRRQAEADREYKDKQRQLKRELMNAYVNAQTEEERGAIRGQLAQLGVSIDRMRGSASPSQFAPSSAASGVAGPAAAPPQPGRAERAAVGMLSDGDSYVGGRPGPGVVAQAKETASSAGAKSPQEEAAISKELSALENAPPMGQGAPATAGIQAGRVTQQPMASQGPTEPGAAPTGGGGIEPGSAGPGQDALQGDWQQGFMAGTAPSLPGRTLASPASFLAQYRREHPEEFGGRPLAMDFLSEGDSYLK